MKRDTGCGHANIKNLDKEICVAGWVNARRDLGGLVFVELRDKTGKLQLVSDPNKNPAVHDLFVKLRNEYVVIARGRLTMRPEGTEKPEQPTGLVEMYPVEVEILNSAGVLPFQVSEGRQVDESLRLKHRYLDLRRPDMQNNLKLRHRVTTSIRSYLDANEFIDVETPILTKATPEGARDF
ncbi:MAG: aspartate--tRNA ligase, partial [Cyanobacteria bacterium HKST-UBA02]|nr:aspartate--tRNA ligase [Cyanobacteria bacterium HKST-UBA02]